MNFLKTLFISLAVLLTGCATQFSESSTLNLTKCPKITHKAPEDFEQAINNYDDLLDSYTTCRLKNNALVDFQLRKK